MPDREPGLTATDDHRLETLRAAEPWLRLSTSLSRAIIASVLYDPLAVFLFSKGQGAELEEALRGRRAALDRVVEGMEKSLRPDLDATRAAAILRALCRPEVYRELVEESGWSPDEYESWLGEIFKRQLLES